MPYNGTAAIEPPRRILVVRLGAMGDVIHALPAVARLKCSFPRARLTWAVESQWSPLLDGNPYVDEVLPLPILGLAEALRHRNLAGIPGRENFASGQPF